MMAKVEKQVKIRRIRLDYNGIYLKYYIGQQKESRIFALTRKLDENQVIRVINLYSLP